MIEGISHITFIVKDLQHSLALFKNVFGAEEVYASNEKQFSLSCEVFLLIGGLWICLMEGEPLEQKTYNHVAFQVPLEELDSYAKKIRTMGLAMRERPRIEGEGSSVYFYDYDGHLFELHAGSLTTRLKAYREARYHTL